MNWAGHAVAFFLIAAAAVAPAAAKNKKSDDAGPAAAGVSHGIVFSVSERTVIQSYFAGGGAAGGGPAKPLPPGIAKKVARGGSLPPGIAKRYLPHDLEARLPPPPVGLERVIVGSDVLLVEISTGAILDMITRALR